MTKVKFLMDYRGALTEELYYQAGAVVEIENDEAAAQLVKQKRAELVVTHPAADRKPKDKAT
jgi:hypothetical protein